MIPPITRPKRKNPVLRTRQPLHPPGIRSRAALGLTAVVLAGLLIASVRNVRRREAELARMEAEAGRGDEG